MKKLIGLFMILILVAAFPLEVKAPKTGDVHNLALCVMLFALGCLITKMAGKYYKR